MYCIITAQPQTWSKVKEHGSNRRPSHSYFVVHLATSHGYSAKLYFSIQPKHKCMKFNAGLNAELHHVAVEAHAVGVDLHWGKLILAVAPTTAAYGSDYSD